MDSDWESNRLINSWINGIKNIIKPSSDFSPKPTTYHHLNCGDFPTLYYILLQLYKQFQQILGTGLIYGLPGGIQVHLVLENSCDLI